MSDDQNDDESNTANEEETIVDFMKEFLESKTWTTLLMTATFWALFQADICTMYFSKAADPALGYIALGWFLVFSFEMTLNFALGLDYGANKGCDKFTFYMILDLVGTASLIPDFLVLFDIELGGADSLTMARAARTARIGARLTRLMKLFRSKGGNSAYSQMMLGDQQEAMEESAASKFGEDVSDGISKKVVMLTLILLIAVPMFMPVVMPSKNDAIKIIEATDTDKLLASFARNDGPISYFQNFEDSQLVKLELLDNPAFTGPATRVGDKKCASYAPATTANCGIHGTGTMIMAFVSDWCPPQPVSANSNFQYCLEDGADIECPVSCKTFTQPLVDWTDKSTMRKEELDTFGPDETSEERKAVRLEAVFYRRNLRVYDAWLTIMYMLFNIVIFGASTGVFLSEIFDLVVNPIERICSALQNLAGSMKSLQQESGDDMDEFEMLGSSILKLTDLLKTSLGEAGTQIIKNNIDAEDDSLNAMVPGHRMNGYFGFCDIRDFDNVLRVLQEDTMVFTNAVSQIVHSKVAEHMGAPNKNMGDSWLSVWSGREEATFSSAEDMTFADHALQAFVEIQDSVQESDTLITMGKNTGFGKGGYVPDMGFGLHYGWAIEGAVGSEVKVDATYLSPHVNMAARLEKATRQYGCTILITEEMYNRMSDGYQRQMRAVDRVMVVGSSWPMKIYAYDEGPDEGNAVLSKKNRFASEFDQATEAYISGEWKDAKKLLMSCLGSRQNHAGVNAMLQYMKDEATGDNAPQTWKGYRLLTSK